LKKLPPQRYDIIVTFCETFDTIYCPIFEGFPPNLFKQVGWTDEKIAGWLEKRFQNACNLELSEQERDDAFFFFLQNTLSQTTVEWQRLYLYQLEQLGKGQEELERSNNEAQKSPLDAKKRDILISAIHNRPRHYDEIRLDLDWLIPTAEKRDAFDAWCIATNLERVKGSNVSKIRGVFLDRALAVPLTETECRQFRRVLQSRSSMVQPERSDELIRTMFRIEVMDGLNRLYLSENRNDEAQKIMLEARELRKEHNLPEGSLLAGMTQGASGQRVVEAEILERETLDESKPAYWMERAAYYQGRKESQEEEKALRKALALFDTPESRREYFRPGFSIVFSALFGFLMREERYPDAFALFRECRTLVRNEPGPLSDLYYSCNDLMKRPEYHNKYMILLTEDIKVAFSGIKNTPLNSRNSNDCYCQLILILRSPNLAVQEHLLDFEKDPFACEFLNWLSEPVAFLEVLLFPPDGGSPLNEAVLSLLEKAMEDDKLTPKTLYYIGKSVHRHGYHAKAVPFLEDALQLEKADNVLGQVLRGQILTDLATCSLELGDWQKGETYTVTNFLESPYDKRDHPYGERDLVSNLIKAAELAEKSGETKEAERIRRRIANLGN
jgi:tetratricopeptide (TPR) repeat protein